MGIWGKGEDGTFGGGRGGRRGKPQQGRDDGEMGVRDTIGIGDELGKIVGGIALVRAR